MRVLISLVAAIPIFGAGLVPRDEHAHGGDIAPSGSAATIDVTVVNQRSIGLAELVAAPAGSPEVRKIVENLGPGRKTIVKLPRGDCVFDLHGIYSDGATAKLSAFDLCKNGRINLVQ